ncbi:hypothetical protein KKA00_06260 [bacterium]|nr:hypothetical protein [bacterium]MBU1651803.1 hypothetical protein [bacterium]
MTIFFLIAFFVLLLVVWAGIREGEISSESMEDQVLTLSLMGIAAFIMLVVLSLFHSLTVYDDGDCLNLRFGVGLITRKIPYDRIKAVKTARHPWWRGLGMRRMPGGCVYSVAGSDVVEVTLKTGQFIRIGTNEPQVLLQVIESRIPSQAKPERRFL